MAAPDFSYSQFLKQKAPRTIVHLNIADFAVAVERLADTSLDGRPVIIAPAGTARALVYDMSEEAYQAGVRKGMPLDRARRTCRDAACLPPHPDRYKRVMDALFREVLPYSPLIEAGEFDGHLFIDLTGTGRLMGPAVDVVRRMYRQIRTRLGLAPVWAVAPNKLVAKVATRLVKPLGEYIVGEGDAAGFLSPLPIDLLPGIEAADRLRLQELNLFRIRQVAELTEDQLAAPFGRRAGLIYDAVRGIDPSPVLPAGEKPSKITVACGFGNDTNAVPAVEQAVYALVEKIGIQLRQRRKAAGSLVISVDYADGCRFFRKLSVCPPSANDIIQFRAARSLLAKAWIRRVRLRHVRLTCPKPVEPQVQMTLFVQKQGNEQKHEALIHAVDNIRARFGRQAVCMGRMMASYP